MTTMTCEDTTAVRVAWEVQLLEPFSRVWLCQAYGRATTTANPADIARAVLAAYLAANPHRAGETFRAIAHTDAGLEAIITADQLTDGWTAGPDVRQALPVHLRQALADCDSVPSTNPPSVPMRARGSSCPDAPAGTAAAAAPCLPPTAASP